MPADPDLDGFERAWTHLRAQVERADSDPGAPSRDELAVAIDDAVRKRVHARETLKAIHGGYWIGDQVLWEREVKVGALARELDHFIEAWEPGGGNLTRDGLLDAVRPLLVEPGSHEAHRPPDELTPPTP